MPGDFSIRVYPYLWKQLKNDHGIKVNNFLIFGIYNVDFVNKLIMGKLI